MALTCFNAMFDMSQASFRAVEAPHVFHVRRVSGVCPALNHHDRKTSQGLASFWHLGLNGHGVPLRNLFSNHLLKDPKGAVLGPRNIKKEIERVEVHCGIHITSL